MADIKTIDKLIPQYLNTDADERLVKSFEMVEALNIRVSHEDDGDSGVLKNIEGNVEIGAKSASDAMPAGVNRVIGSTSSEAGKCIYFFLYNSAGSHGIYRYGVTDDKYQKVYENSVLNFAESGFVKGDVVINQFDEHLLYFTDNRNEPRKINVNKALSGGYLSGSLQQELFLTVCKQPPQVPITFEFQTTGVNLFNHLKEKVFQFAYQYIYDDGEVSALSAYSKLAVSQTHLAYNDSASDFLGSYNNELLLTVRGTDAPVKKIHVYARINNLGNFYKIQELPNPGGGFFNGYASFKFRNNGTYPVLAESEVNKPFDAVPKRAASQVVTNNRLFYGDYTEGFDNVTTDAYIYPVYNNGGGTSESFNVNTLIGDAWTENHEVGVPNYNTPAVIYALQGPHFEAGTFLDTTHYGASNDGVNGVGFDLDMSEIPADGLLNGGSFAFQTEISASRIGIASFRGNYGSAVDYPDFYYNAGDTGAGEDLGFPVEVSTYSVGGETLIHTDTLYAVSPNHSAGAIKLALTNRIVFNRTFTNSGSASKAEAAEQIIQGIVGAIANVGVAPTSEPYFTEGFNWTGASCMLAASKNVEGWSGGAPDQEHINQMLVWLRGTVKFQVASGVYIAATDKIEFKFKLIDTDLTCDYAQSFQYTSQGGATFTSQFISPSNYNLLSDSKYLKYTIPTNNCRHKVFQNSEINLAIDSNITNDYGVPISDVIHDNSKSTRTFFSDFKMQSGGLDVLTSTGDVSMSFKAGATHDFGVVYYDHRNRASGVQKIGSVDTVMFGDSERSGRNGPTEIDIRLMHTPPAWAKKWAPVYAKNSTYERFLQVTIAEAALGQTTTWEDIRATGGASLTTRPITRSLSGGVGGEIFISLRGLEGKSNSYVDFRGSMLSYTFEEGDILRVLEYTNPDGVVVRPNKDFRITSYKFYSDDELNPIKLSDTSGEEDEKNYRRTGWWLTIRDNDIDGFDRGAVSISKDYFSQKCLVEIFHHKKPTADKVYYEIGQVYDIKTVGGSLTHGGVRSNSTSPVFSLSVVSTTQFRSSQRLFRGDKVLTAASPSGSVFIETISPSLDGTYVYSVWGGQPMIGGVFIGSMYENNTISTEASAGSNALFNGVVTIKQGDVYFRIREQLINTKKDYLQGGVTFLYDPTEASSQLYDKFFVESGSVSDFFDSEASHLGRPHIELDEAKEIRRKSAVTYSDVSTSDSDRLRLSNFNPVNFPFKDYNTQHGAITSLLDREDSILVLQEKKIVIQPIGRTLIESAEGGQLVTSTEVLGTETYMSGSYGPGKNPESIVQRFGKTFFVDIEAGKVIAVTSKGVSLISDVGMEAYFEYKFATLLEDGSVIHIPCGIDPENNEFIVTTPGFEMNDISVGGILIVTANTPADTTYEAMTSWSFNTTTISWDTEPSCWNMANDIEPWEEIGQGAIYLDKINDVGFSLIDPEFIASNIFNVAILNTAGTFRGVAVVKINQNAIDVGSGPYNDTVTCGESLAVAFVANSSIGAAETVAYSTTYEKWMSMYTFVPEFYGHIHNKFFSYNAGKMYRHNVNPIRNNFYSIQASSKVRLISNQNPSSIKTYNALSLESNNKKWAGVISNTNQTASMPLGMLQEKEGLMYSNIPRDSAPASTSKSTSHKIVLGEVTDVAGAVITFASRVSNLPFGLGDMVWKIGQPDTTTSLTVSEVTSRTSLTLSADASAAVSVGDTLMAISSGAINGDKIRDYYASVELTLSSTETAAVELYAVNMVYAPSNLHNEGTQGVGGSQKKA